MSKTYIAHLQERYIEKRSDGEEWLQMPVNVSGHELTIKTVIPLTPYTEPDLDAIRKEAYKDGREAGIKDGMCEAWEAARKIVHLQWDGAWAGVDEVEKWFDTYTASEAIEKIRQHEQEQEEIKVGDEVAFHHDDGRPDTVVFVTHIGQDGFIDGMDGRGTQYAHKNPKKWTKTGRHIPEIAEVLRKMQEEES